MNPLAFSILPDERIILALHKHWFMLIKDAAGTVLLGLFVSLGGSAAFGIMGDTSNTASALFLFANVAWLLVLWMMLVIIWTDHYLDMWVVTDRRIIHAEQIRLFVREVTTLHLERVQDATVTYGGFIETMLHFGTIHIESAGADAAEITMHGMPQPDETKRMILELVDDFREKHVYTHRSDEQAEPPPTQSD